MTQPALKKIDEIANVLLNIPPEQDTGLYTGNAGIALFLFYYAKYKNDMKIHQKALEMVNDLFKRIEEATKPQFSHCSGIAGVGWLVHHLCRQRFMLADPDKLLAEIDEYLYVMALSEFERGNYDFMHGAMGMVFYFIKRNDRDYLQRLIKALTYITVWDGNCAKWESVIKYEEGIKGFNIAMSHGSSSIALVLCKVLQIMPEEETAQKLLQGAITYILNQEIPVEQYGSYFPTFSIESQPEVVKTRLAWCYGDLGVALAIWKSGVVLQKKEWVEKGMEVLLHAAERRGLYENRVNDAGICHGAAGIAQIYKRLFISTGLKVFNEAADYWHDEILKLDTYKDGLAGYKAVRLEKYGGAQPINGLLEGIAGIGLCLLSFVMQEDPAWDECFLLS